MVRSKPLQQLIVVIVVLTAVVAAVVVSFALFGQKKEVPNPRPSATPKTTFSDESRGVSFQYLTNEFLERPLGQEDKEEGVLVRLGGPPNKPRALWLIQETGLRKVTSLVKKDTIDVLIENSAARLPRTYPGYNEVSTKNFEVDEHKAHEKIFTYKGNTGETIKQRLLIVVNDSDSAFYMYVEARAPEFDELNKKVFETSFDSLKLGP